MCIHAKALNFCLITHRSNYKFQNYSPKLCTIESQICHNCSPHAGNKLSQLEVKANDDDNNNNSRSLRKAPKSQELSPVCQSDEPRQRQSHCCPALLGPGEDGRQTQVFPGDQGEQCRKEACEQKGTSINQKQPHWGKEDGDQNSTQRSSTKAPLRVPRWPPPLFNHPGLMSRVEAAADRERCRSPGGEPSQTHPLGSTDTGRHPPLQSLPPAESTPLF